MTLREQIAAAIWKSHPTPDHPSVRWDNLFPGEWGHALAFKAADAILPIVEAAIHAEREACANVAEFSHQTTWPDDWVHFKTSMYEVAIRTAKEIAAGIRARSVGRND